MAIKKSQLYSSLWDAANQLRGGMDASSYKDYVLVFLFVKYVSDKYGNDLNADLIVPEGGSFKDMIAANGKKDIGERINTIISKLAESNDLKGVIDKTDFDDSDKLGKDKEKVDTLTKLVGIFENPDLNFSSNKAGGDDILGDVYEYFMKNFASESGKSKGQFYTPAEVSKIMARIIGVENAKSADQTAYDPACGSGSLLLKVASESNVNITLYGQEKDISVSVLAKMNMILHGKPDAEIGNGNTLANPLFKEKDKLKTFDFCVANPPFSDSGWMSGILPKEDEFHRFDDGVPPEKNGDYAFLSHFIKSLKHTGRGAIILPHGVLFRGGSEGIIRRNFIKKGYIKGIIGLPMNLFFGTGIPAAILIIDKENAVSRKGIFMIDASKGFIKDGNKNRLREQDVHKIVDVFLSQEKLPRYSKMVKISEIENNEYNLNIPRYIDSSVEEDIQDIYAHLNGGIPSVDIDKLDKYWKQFPSLHSELFEARDEKYLNLKVSEDSITETIFKNSEFQAFRKDIQSSFSDWKKKNSLKLEAINDKIKAKELIKELSNDILVEFKSLKLINGYAVYQHLMDYWETTFQDDVYIIISDGWKVEISRIIEVNKKGKETDKGWICDLLPKSIVIAEYFDAEKNELQELETKKDSFANKMEEIKEEYSGEEGLLESAKTNSGSITKASLNARIGVIKNKSDYKEELDIIKKYLKLISLENAAKNDIKVKNEELDVKLLQKYPKLTEAELKDLVINKKWYSHIEDSVNEEQERISQILSQRIKELVVRYHESMPVLEDSVEEYENKVKSHLAKMGF
ncbi:MAG: N-6 DNA methylase [Marinifilaceae bacterium]